MGQLNILCVDDNDDILAIARLALGLDPQIAVRSATNGPDALRTLLSPDWPVHAILLDIRMPGEDGRTLFGEIRNIPIHSDTPVIFMSGYVTAEERAECMALGAAAVIPKPFDPVILPKQLRQILAHPA